MANLGTFKNQFLDANGNPLNGGKVYTYAAGTNNPKATYTDSTGLVANTNPVILDSAGMANIWLSGLYKVTVANSLDVPLYTVDNVNQLSDASQIVYTPAGTGSVASNIQTKLREFVSVKDFGAVGNGVTDDSIAIANAIQSLTSGGELIFENGKNYLCASSVVNATTIPQSIRFVGGGGGVQGASGGTRITYTGTGICFNVQFNTGFASIGGWSFEGIEFVATNAAGSMFQWNDYALSPVLATPPRTIRQVKYSHCTFTGPGGATVTGFAISGMKVFELNTDENCEFYSWNKAIRLKGCDNCTIKGRFQNNVVDLEHLKSGTYGNNLVTQGTFLAKNTTTGGTTYGIYSTGFQDLHINPYLESDGIQMYLEGYGQTVIAPWNSAATSGTYLQTGASLTACNILYPRVSALQTAVLTLANLPGELLITNASQKWIDSIFGSLPNPAVRFIGGSLTPNSNPRSPRYIGSDIITNNGASIGRVNSMTAWTGVSNLYAGVLSVAADAGAYLGYALKATAAAGSVGGAIGALTCGRNFSNGDCLRVTIRYRQGAVRAAGTSRYQLFKNGANVTNAALTDSLTYTNLAFDYTISGYVDGDTFSVGAYNLNSDVDMYVAAITIEVMPYMVGSATWNPPSIANGAQSTTTVTVTGAALGDSVDSISFSLDQAGIQFTGYVSAANTVTVVASNMTGGAVDLASGTVSVRVNKA